MKQSETTKNVTEKRSTKEKYDSYLDIIWTSLIFFVIIGTGFMMNPVFEFRKKLIENNSTYEFPKVTGLILSLFIFIVLSISQLLLCSLFKKTIVEKTLALKYVNAKDEKMEMLANIYRTKLSIHLYKASFYLLLSIYGFIVLKDYDFFPKSLLGKGQLENMFLKGYPQTFYFKRTYYFDLYYLMNLGYYFSDFACLLLNEKQSDFILMLLHHICTISLILFSYLSNFCQVGAVVLFLHMESDIFVHSTRYLLHTRFPAIFAEISGVILTINFIYMRIFVFGKIIYVIYYYITWEWGNIVWSLWLFLVFLFFMHIYWSYALLFKAYELLFKAKLFEDTANYNKTLNKKIDKEK
jgi:hypothetical protein